MVFRLRTAPLEPGKPRWLTAGTIRLLVLCAFIVAVWMIRPRLTYSAGIVLVVGGALVVAALVAFLGSTRRLAARLPLLDRSQRVAEALMLQIRRAGLPLLGLACFLLWTFVYLGLWWFRPEGAFDGLAANPRFSDLFYYAVSTAFISPPGDIVAASRGARSATMIEMLTAFALLTAYLSSFVDWRGQVLAEQPEPEREV